MTAHEKAKVAVYQAQLDEIKKVYYPIYEELDDAYKKHQITTEQFCNGIRDYSRRILQLEQLIRNLRFHLPLTFPHTI